MERQRHVLRANADSNLSHLRPRPSRLAEVPEDSTRESALTLAHAGFAVLPLHTATEGRCSCGQRVCASPGKHPATPRGEHDATTDPETVERLFPPHRPRNVGIATGPSGLVVVDIDPRHGGDESYAALEANLGPFPPTWEVVTGGGGCHVYFRSPKSERLRSRAGLLDGIDVRASTGYVIAPPSLHASGRRYAWEVSSHPADIPLAPLPPSLISLLRDRSSAGSVKEIPDAILEGSRNATLYWVACALRSRGLLQAEIEAAIRAMNDGRCHPPVDDRELQGIVASACRHPVGQLPEPTQRPASAPAGEVHRCGLRTITAERSTNEFKRLGGGTCPE